MSGTGVPLDRRGRRIMALIGLAILIVFAVANAHLVYVSLVTHPACVPHLKSPGEDGSYRAARSDC